MWRKSIGVKLILVVGFILILSMGIFAYVNIASQKKQLIGEVKRGAIRISETVRRSTRYDMLRYQSKDPRPKGGALKSKQFQLTLIFFPMIFNVSSNHLRGYFIPNCPGKIASTPKLSTPKKILQPRKFSENPA